jgi:hypothetical protein
MHSFSKVFLVHACQAAINVYLDRGRQPAIEALPMCVRSFLLNLPLSEPVYYLPCNNPENAEANATKAAALLNLLELGIQASKCFH